MRNADRGERAALRVKLLLGVAGATAAASSAAFADQAPAAPSDPDKWVPYTDIGGGFGSGMTAGKADAFVPIWQNIDSLLFANLGIGTETKTNQFENFGFGYRTKINPEWILGGYAGFDSTQLQDNNTFNQVSLGAELMSAEWDLRLNGYLAGSEARQHAGQYGLYINGTTIAILDGQDVGYRGFDGEVGYRVFNTDDTDVRLFIGGFSFGRGDSAASSMGQNFDFGYHDITGPKARAEVTVYDLDLLGPQSRLTVGGEVAYDDVRKTTGYIGATLRIPLGDFGGGAQALDELDRRMADPERRNDTVLTRSQFTKPEPVIIYGAGVKSQPTNTLLYVDNTLGVGTYANPTTFADAAARPTTNAFIVLTSKQGPVMGGATLQPGQTVVAGGQSFTVEGEFSHAKFNHLFDPSTDVTLIPATAGGNVVTLASNTSLYGFTIKGDFGDAVYGKNVDNVNINHVTIDGTGGGHRGIEIAHTVSGTETVTISDVTIAHLTNDGIYLHSNLADGGTSTETFSLSGITIANAASGIVITDNVGAGSRLESDISIDDATITNSRFQGILIEANAAGAGSALDQAVAISNTEITGGEDGIFLSAYAGGGAHVTSKDSLSEITITGSGYNGIASYTEAFGTGSVLNQTLDFQNITVTDGGYDGVYIGVRAGIGGAVNQTVSISGLTISGISGGDYGDGLSLYAGAFGAGSTVYQTATIANANVSYVTGNIYGNGIYVGANARGGGAVVQSATIDPSSSTHNGFGLSVRATAYDYGQGQTTIEQTVTVTGTAANPTNLSYNTDGGVVVEAIAASGLGFFTYGSEAAISQTVSVTDAVIDHNFNGVVGFVGASNGASATQNISLSNVEINHNAHYGVWLEAYSETQGFTAQNLTIEGSTSSYSQVSYNGADGIFIKTGATYGGLVQQNINIYDTNIDQNGGDGLRVENEAVAFGYHNGQLYYSHIQQNFQIAYGSISANAGNGVSISNTAIYGAQLDQFVYLYGEKLDHNGAAGFAEYSVAKTYAGGGFNVPTNLHSDVYIINSDVSYNGLGSSQSGISIAAHLYSPEYAAINVGFTYLEQHITVSGTTANHNGADGIYVSALDQGIYGLNLQYITLSGSQFAHNAGDGAHLSAYQKYGPGSFGAADQIVTITNSDFSHNVGNGLYAYAGADGQQGRAEQHFTVEDSTFDENGENGIDLVRVSRDGVYLTNYGCGVIQGLPGGCALVRTTFDMTGGSASGNALGGIAVYNHAYNYGAIYATTDQRKHAKGVSGYIYSVPTVELNGVTVDNNLGNGLYSKTVARGGSYVYNYILSLASTFDGNGTNGFATTIYAGNGSTIVERNALFSYHGVVNSASNNGQYGLSLRSIASGGSIIQSTNIIYGLTAQHNGLDGVSIIAGYVDHTSYEHQYNYFGSSNISYNVHNGVTLVSIGQGVGTGPGAGQYSRFGNPAYLTGNTITHNGHYGVAGYANVGGYQLVNIYHEGNTVTGNTANNYYFEMSGGFQNVY
jgi:hypothetical protein